MTAGEVTNENSEVFGEEKVLREKASGFGFIDGTIGVLIDLEDGVSESKVEKVAADFLFVDAEADGFADFYCAVEKLDGVERVCLCLGGFLILGDDGFDESGFAGAVTTAEFDSAAFGDFEIDTGEER